MHTQTLDKDIVVWSPTLNWFWLIRALCASAAHDQKHAHVGRPHFSFVQFNSVQQAALAACVVVVRKCSAHPTTPPYTDKKLLSAPRISIERVCVRVCLQFSSQQRCLCWVPTCEHQIGPIRVARALLATALCLCVCVCLLSEPAIFPTSGNTSDKKTRWLSHSAKSRPFGENSGRIIVVYEIVENGSPTCKFEIMRLSCSSSSYWIQIRSIQIEITHSETVCQLSNRTCGVTFPIIKTFALWTCIPLWASQKPIETNRMCVGIMSITRQVADIFR